MWALIFFAGVDFIGLATAVLLVIVDKNKDGVLCSVVKKESSVQQESINN